MTAMTPNANSQKCTLHIASCTKPCATALFHLDPFYAKIRSDYVLVDEKDNGGLFVPSEDLGLVCKETERTIRELEAVSSNLKKVSSREIEKMTLGKLLRSNVFSDLRFTLTEDHTAESSHVYHLLQLIIEQYTKIRLHHIARQRTLSLSPSTVRTQMNKLVLFRGQ
jgi:hypothetical protein